MKTPTEKENKEFSTYLIIALVSGFIGFALGVAMTILITA